MNKYITYIILAFLLVQYSCVSDAEFEIEGADSRVFFYSEFEPGYDFMFKYSSAIGLNDLTPEINPIYTSDFTFQLKKESELLSPSFRYDPVLEMFISPSNAQVIETNSFYSIKSSLTDYPALKEITASTYIHAPKDFNSIEVIENRSIVLDEVYNLDEDLQFSVDVSHPHYELEVYIVDPESVGNLKKIPVSLINSIKGVTPLPNRTSLLIDSKELNNQFVQVNITDSFDASLAELNEGIIVKLKTVSQDHFRYHITLAKELETSYAPLFEPVINYTNIDNGIGLLSGYSSSRHIIEFVQ